MNALLRLVLRSRESARLLRHSTVDNLKLLRWHAIRVRALANRGEETARSRRRRVGCHQRHAFGPHGRNVNVLVRDGQLSARRRQSKRKRLIRLSRSRCVTLVLVVNFRLWALAQSEQKVFDSSDENLVVKGNDVAPTRDFQIWVGLLNHHGPKYILVRLRLLGVLVNDILEL